MHTHFWQQPNLVDWTKISTSNWLRIFHWCFFIRLSKKVQFLFMSQSNLVQEYTRGSQHGTHRLIGEVYNKYLRSEWWLHSFDGPNGMFQCYLCEESSAQTSDFNCFGFQHPNREHARERAWRHKERRHEREWTSIWRTREETVQTKLQPEIVCKMPGEM